MKRIALGVLMIGLTVSGVYGQKVTKVGTTAAPFLSIGVGSRAIGMGGAFVSTADDATALFWNVSGIARLPKNQIVLDHAEWIAGINFDFAGAVWQLGPLGTLGASFTSLSMGDMERTTEYQPEGTGELFSAGSFAIGLSYARNLTDRFSIGFTGKYISEKIFNSGAHGVALDIGTLYTTPFHDMKIGMSISNFGTKMQMSGRDLLVQYDIDPLRAGNNGNLNANLQTDQYDLPLMFRVGVSMNLLRSRSNHSLLVAVDALHPSDNVESLNVGTEYRFMDLISLRAGYKRLFSRDSEEGLTAGAGFQYTFLGNVGIQLDYAFQSFGRLRNVNRFSFVLMF